MVLAELGTQISGALRKLNQTTVIDEEALDACIKEICNALLLADVQVNEVLRIRKDIKTQVNAYSDASGVNKRKLIQQVVVSELTSLLDPDKPPYKLVKGKVNVVMFVGLQGSGKTTTCTKYAHYYKRKGWKTALVCADTFRAGAFDQLKQNATKTKIPFYGSYDETDPVKIARDGVDHFRNSNYEVIIVDTSGRHKQEEGLFDEMKQVAANVSPNEIIFVMDSSIGQACADQARAFKETVDVGSVIITKLDGHAKGGGAISAVAATESPIVFIGTGEHFDEFEEFQPKSFIKRLLGLGDIPGLFEAVREAIPLDKQSDMMESIGKGQFTLRNMYEQFQSVLKMGSLSHFMSMIPGVGQNLLPKGGEKKGIEKIKKYICMMDSMTDDELDGNKPLEASRIQRIARGSGNSIRWVNELIEEHKRIEKMVSKMGKMKLGKGNDMSALTRNPGQMMQNLGKFVDPRVMKQMGGPQNMMNMMKEMSKMDLGGMGGMGGMGAGDMGDMAGMGDMMKMLGGGGRGGGGRKGRR
eukprot:CAMPEP_0114997646 /NCGR_PEP_ID=MMETSP0216-20121206/15019_1 /TAXON_ID=223996 /ORGANISM="Protocruzia adherens, Strain Boccale" /LENGTH=526 /DNA_ID=CAMNT_0002362059 /DNA_START=20 /DNA_END=1600 /DNA_ORIENTATION=+